MNTFKRIMIGLDMTLMDEVLIRYTAFLCERLRPEKLYFVTVQESLDIPEEIRAEFPEMDAPRDEQVRADLARRVEGFFPEVGAWDAEYVVIEGSPRREILRWTHIKDVDLLIVGRKDRLKGSGITPVQLARKVSCSLLFVPERPPATLDTAIVGTDFSECAHLALDQALQVVETSEAPVIWVLHSFTVPMGYYKTGKTETQFAEIMKGHAARHYDDFIAPVQVPAHVKVAPILAYDARQESPAVMIHDRASREGADLIVVGARGRSAVTALLLGSVAERLLKLEGQTPLLLAKRKNVTFSFMDMIEAI